MTTAICHFIHYDGEKITHTQEGFYFNNTYNVIKEFFRVEYEKSINAEIIQPFQSPYETMIFLTRVHVWVLHLSLNNLVYFKINSVVVKKRIPLSFHVLRETWSPLLCVYKCVNECQSKKFSLAT